jgi:hypothetical protein
MFLRNKKKGFEDTRKSNQKRKSNHRQYNGQKKKDKMTNNNPQNITQTTKIEQYEPTK